MIDRRHIRTRMTFWFVAALAVVVLLYSATACFFLLRDLRTQLVRYAIQDVETVEGLLYFKPDGRLTLRDDYHNHPESKRVLERLVEVRSPDGKVLLRNELLGDRSLGDTLLPNEEKAGTPNAGLCWPMVCTCNLSAAGMPSMGVPPSFGWLTVRLRSGINLEPT